jgi:hypothetical protein
MVRLGKDALPVEEVQKQEIPPEWLRNRDAKLAAMAREDFDPMPRRAVGMR